MYFKLDKGTRHSEPISACLFILVLEIVFNLTKENKNIHDLTFFDPTFLYTVYAADTTFFIKDKESVKEVMNVFVTFFIYSGFKLNKSKRGVNRTLWNGMCRFNQTFSKNLRYLFFL